MNVRFEILDPNELELLEKNARYMRNETFTQLVQNVKKDGALTSVPFACRTPAGKWRVLSGNHRVKAARVAKLQQIPVLVTDDDLTPDQQRAIQLSHNALVGEDDMAVLKQIYESIDSIDFKQYAGLDDKTLDLLAKVQTDPAIRAPLAWTTVTMTFLPEEVQKLREVFQIATGFAKGEQFYAMMGDYHRFMEALSLVSGAHNVANNSTCLMLLLEVFERHLDDLEQGFVAPDGSARHKQPVPTAAAFGALQVPPDVAATVRKALNRARSEAPEDERERGSLVRRICEGYLATLESATPAA
jgi:hypothetical protein